MAHAAGLIHRDIKPSNIIVAGSGGIEDVAKLLDFGLVLPPAGSGAPGLTREGQVLGTPLYMAPEQATGDGRAVDGRSDLYALGAVAYYLLTGRPPFEGEDGLAVLIAHARDPVVPPSRVRAGIPEDLERVVLRCLAKDPAERFADAAGLERALDGAPPLRRGRVAGPGAPTPGGGGTSTCVRRVIPDHASSREFADRYHPGRGIRLGTCLGACPRGSLQTRQNPGQQIRPVPADAGSLSENLDAAEPLEVRHITLAADDEHRVIRFPLGRLRTPSLQVRFQLSEPEMPARRAVEVIEPHRQIVGDGAKRRGIRVAVPVVIKQDKRLTRWQLAADGVVESPFGAPVREPRAQQPEAETVSQPQPVKDANGPASQPHRRKAAGQQSGSQPCQTQRAQIDQGTSA